MSLEILIGADVAPTASNVKAFQSESPNLLFNGLSDVWHRADARIFALGTPLADAQSLSEPCGPSCRCVPAACAAGFAALNPAAVSLCSESILDCGTDGVLATRAALKAKGIATFGAGEDRDEADQPHYFVKHGVRVGIYAVSGTGNPVATDRKAGANPVDLLNIGDRVRELKSSCDRLIVLYRGERESYPYPSPEMQRACRKMAECGASLVVCQHGNWIGCSERWDNTTIVYGQGNFIHDADSKIEGSGTGLLVRYTIGDYGADSVEYVPVVSASGGAALADEAKAAEIVGAFQKRSLRIRMEGFVSARYEEDHSGDKA